MTLSKIFLVKSEYFDITNKEKTQIPKSESKKFSILCTFKGRGRGLNQRERERGNSLQSWVENTNMTDCNISSV
jgi:hypothetical protein